MSTSAQIVRPFRFLAHGTLQCRTPRHFSYEPFAFALSVHAHYAARTHEITRARSRMGVEMLSITADVLPRVARIARESFRVDIAPEPWLRDGRVLVEGGEVRAVVLVEPLGQYF